MPRAVRLLCSRIDFSAIDGQQFPVGVRQAGMVFGFACFRREQFLEFIHDDTAASAMKRNMPSRANPGGSPFPDLGGSAFCGAQASMAGKYSASKFQDTVQIYSILMFLTGSPALDSGSTLKPGGVRFMANSFTKCEALNILRHFFDV
jgi:hypothetical protein